MRKRPATPAAPPGLSAEAKALWRQTTGEYSFDTASDYALLRQLCETLDRLREVQKAIKETGLMVTGSTGQPRPNPLLQTEDAARRTLMALVRALRLTNTPEF